MTRRSKKSARVSKRKVSRKGSKKVSRKGKKGSRKGTKKRGLLARLRSRMRRGKRGSRKSKGKNSVAVLVPAKGGQRGGDPGTLTKLGADKIATVAGDNASMVQDPQLKGVFLSNGDKLPIDKAKGEVDYDGNKYNVFILTRDEVDGLITANKLDSSTNLDTLFPPAAGVTPSADGS